MNDDPRIEAYSSGIADAWLNDNVTPWSIPLLHGISNHFQRKMMDKNWPVLARTIRESSSRGLSDTINGTTLRIFSSAGRCLITLARPDDENGEESITFLAYEHDDDDWWGGAVQSFDARLSTALAMIEDVTENTVVLEADNKISVW